MMLILFVLGGPFALLTIYDFGMVDERPTRPAVTASTDRSLSSSTRCTHFLSEVFQRWLAWTSLPHNGPLSPIMLELWRYARYACFQVCMEHMCVPSIMLCREQGAKSLLQGLRAAKSIILAKGKKVEMRSSLASFQHCC